MPLQARSLHESSSTAGIITIGNTAGTTAEENQEESFAKNS